MQIERPLSLPLLNASLLGAPRAPSRTPLAICSHSDPSDRNSIFEFQNSKNHFLYQNFWFTIGQRSISCKDWRFRVWLLALKRSECEANALLLGHPMMRIASWGFLSRAQIWERSRCELCFGTRCDLHSLWAQSLSFSPIVWITEKLSWH